MNCHNKMMRWTLCSSFAAFITFISLTDIDLFSSIKKRFYPASGDFHQKYVIVFDGGSTGTRIHIFSFKNNTDGLLIFQNEYFQETKPGLSSFVDSPKNAALSVQNLLENAKLHVPVQQWYDTPVFLKATAGLRLLPTQESNLILEEVSNLFKNSPFYSEENSVSVLDGKDEGVYAWFTLNFLLGHLEQTSRSVALLDLGGGSIQVTFAPVDLDSIVFSPTGYITNRRVYNRSVTIYTHSYLGLGLMSARLSIMSLTSDGEEITNNKHLRSPCISPDVEAHWKYNNDEYTVSGLKSGDYGFSECYSNVLTFLGDAVHKPAELWKREVYGISYYFDRASDSGLIGKSGEIVTVSEYFAAAANSCSKKTTSSPFLCLDVTYISALLHHGLGFSKEKELKLVNQIDGTEASWGLGAAFSMLK